MTWQALLGYFFLGFIPVYLYRVTVGIDRTKDRVERCAFHDCEISGEVCPECEAEDLASLISDERGQ